MKQLCYEAIRRLESGESFVQATVLQSSGSTPREAGACMIILNDGGICGTVGGGALEGGIIKAAPEVFHEKKARAINVVLDGNDAAAMGVICGGAATVLVDYIDAGHPGNLEFYTALDEALSSSLRAKIVMVLPDHGSSTQRSQCLLMHNGVLLGSAGVEPAVLSVLEVSGGSYDAFTRLDSFNVYLFNVGTDGTAYIFGAGHCGEKLARVLATVSFATVVIDDRPEFANTGRFPEADRIMVPESMDLPFNEIEFDEDSYIVIVTRGHTHDELVLRGALRTSAGYVGMIGSRKKREQIYRNLLADGYNQDDIDRVYSPIGIAIGAETPEEIAISIAAEMVKVRADRRKPALK